MTAMPVGEARRTTRRAARTFALACRMLPRRVRDDVYLLYLVFRTLDDLVDGRHPQASERVGAVEAWAAGAAARGAEPEILDELSRRRPLPRGALADFCAGMRFDLAGGVNRTEQDVDRYCYRVAGTVGLAMTAVLGATDPRAPRHAVALGMAMQRTNVLRDIDEDLAEGRVYLAQDTLERFGGCLAPGRREALLRDQIRRADALYDEGLAGIRHLACGRRAVTAAALMYREILRQIEREGHGAHAGRAVVAPPRRVAVAARGVTMVR